MAIILTVEDDVDLALFNARLLTRQGYAVLIAHTAVEARALASEHDPDLLILDIQLPDGDGMALCADLRRGTDAPILFLSGISETSEKVTGLQTGGDYYLTKPCDKDEFLAVVNSLLRRVNLAHERVSRAVIIDKGSLTLNLDERRAFINGLDAELTQKEFAILALLVQNEDRELSYDLIYETVWGAQMNGNPTALRKQISRIKRKLNEDHAKDFAIFNQHGVGYTFSCM